jgi:hypothetical protein
MECHWFIIIIIVAIFILFFPTSHNEEHYDNNILQKKYQEYLKPPLVKIGDLDCQAPFIFPSGLLIGYD